MLTQQRLVELLHYDKATGVFTWRQRRGGKANQGAVAGWCNKKGYRRIELDDVPYMAHRLAILYVLGRWPSDQVDHLNGVTDDNSWENLAEVDCATNLKRRHINSRNTSGCPGVSYNTRCNKWVVKIVSGGKTHYLGMFVNKQDAVAKRIEAEQAMGFTVLGREVVC